MRDLIRISIDFWRMKIIRFIYLAIIKQLTEKTKSKLEKILLEKMLFVAKFLILFIKYTELTTICGECHMIPADWMQTDRQLMD